jgi:MFS family permease
MKRDDARAGEGAGRSALGAIFLTVVVDLIGFGIVLPLLPRYAREFRATPLEIGALMASFSAMQFLFAPLWGRISDRVGRRPILLLGLAGSVAFYAAFGFARSLSWLFFARIAGGICGATISISAAYIADVTKPAERARGMALIGAAFGIGFTAGPPIGGYAFDLGRALAARGLVSSATARGLPGFVAAGLSLVSLLWTLAAVREPARRAAAPRPTLARAALREALAAPGVALLLGLSFLSVFSFANFEGTISLMLADRFDYDERKTALVFLFIGVTLSLAQGVIVRRLVPRFGERAFVRLGAALMAIGLLGVAFADGLPALLPSLALAVTGFGAVTPSISSLVSRRTDPGRQGAVLGVAQSVAALGRILGPTVGNVVYGGPAAAGAPALVALVFGDLAHHRRPYVLAAAILGVLAALALAIPPAADAAPEEAEAAPEPVPERAGG